LRAGAGGGVRQVIIWCLVEAILPVSSCIIPQGFQGTLVGIGSARFEDVQRALRQPLVTLHVTQFAGCLA
jgi:hypothetical protein